LKDANSLVLDEIAGLSIPRSARTDMTHVLTDLSAK